MMKKKRLLLGLVVSMAVAGLAASCKVPGKPQPFTTLSADVSELRAAFNADAGKVRLIVLVAPS